MAMIQGIRIRNFKSLKNITLGNVCDGSNTQPLTPITAVIGKNSVGKTSLFDVFGFLADCMKYGVAEACDVRGGFDRVASQGQTEPIELVLCYSVDNSLGRELFGFELTITQDTDGLPYVKRERLYRGKEILLAFNEGKGFAWQSRGGYIFKQEDEELELQEVIDNPPGEWRKSSVIGHFSAVDRPKLYYAVTDPNTGIKYFPPEGRAWRYSEERMRDIIEEGRIIFTGDPKKAPLENRYIVKVRTFELANEDKYQLAIAICAKLIPMSPFVMFRQFVENWYMSYFTPDAARNVNQKGAQQHLNRSGDNLSNVVEFMMDKHPERFQAVLERIASKIPGIGKISTYRDSVTRNLYLMFEGKGFAKPFTQAQMSDGTLKLFTYLLLLEDPEPAPLLCIEEPENGLYHQLLETLAQEIREHTSKGNSQVFITTHQPYFVDALEPEEVWILEKGEDGFSTIRRASDDPLIQNMVEEGLPLGGLWYSGYLDRG